MRVLIAGGAGYLGVVLAEELLARGLAVRVLDRLYFGEAPLREVRDRVELWPGDVRTPPEDALDGVDAVVNLAAFSNDATAEYAPEATQETNAVGAFRLAERCKARGIRRYVLASTCAVYDRGLQDERGDVAADEDAAVSPRAALARSKQDAERLVLSLVDAQFCAVILRKGTLYGFSPRMRYDLVVNAFVKDALAKGVLHLYAGGELWRPIVEVRDAARAYIAAIEAPEPLVRGQIFNVVFDNLRISEVALRVREALRSVGVTADLRPDYSYRPVRSYRALSGKLDRALGLRARITVEESVAHLVERIRAWGYTDYDNPRYDNLRWMRVLEDAQGVLGVTRSVLEAPTAGRVVSPVRDTGAPS